MYERSADNQRSVEYYLKLILSLSLSLSFSLSANADKLETETIVDLTPGESYLIYVTANLSMGKPLPYQTLTVHMGSHCPELESQELPEYY